VTGGSNAIKQASFFNQDTMTEKRATPRCNPHERTLVFFLTNNYAYFAWLKRSLPSTFYIQLFIFVYCSELPNNKNLQNATGAKIN
jgi:hypothetical protein